MRTLALMLGLIAAAALPAPAQQLVSQSVPGSAWIDLRPAEEGAPPQTVPSWVTGLDMYAVSEIDGTESTLIAFELDAAQLAVIGHSGVQLRLVFADLPGARPTVYGVDAEGNVISDSGELGDGLGMLTSECVQVGPEAAALHIEVPGDGLNVMTAFLSLLAEAAVMRTADAPAASRPVDLFERSMLPAYSEDDLYLYGRVRAVLTREVVSLTESDAVVEVDLDDKPLLAVLRFRVNGAEVTNPLWVSVNGGTPQYVTYRLPDLADPAYLGIVRGEEPGMSFRYVDWLEAEVAIPGTRLLPNATNDLEIIRPQPHGPVAIRDLVLELKFNWDRLNYDIEP